MTSRVTVSAHPGTGVTYVEVKEVREGSEKVTKVEAQETKDFYVYDDIQLIISEK